MKTPCTLRSTLTCEERQHPFPHRARTGTQGVARPVETRHEHTLPARTLISEIGELTRHAAISDVLPFSEKHACADVGAGQYEKRAFGPVRSPVSLATVCSQSVAAAILCCVKKPFPAFSMANSEA